MRGKKEVIGEGQVGREEREGRQEGKEGRKEEGKGKERQEISLPRSLLKIGAYDTDHRVAVFLLCGCKCFPAIENRRHAYNAYITIGLQQQAC